MNKVRQYCNNRYGTTFCETAEELFKQTTKSATGSIDYHAFEYIDEIVEEVASNKSLKHKSPEHKQKVKDLITPIFFDVATKPNTTKVAKVARQRAILNKASAIYNRTKSEQATNQYLATQGVNNYVIDYNLSSPDALVAINTKNNQATLAFRGSQNMLRNGSDWFENAEVFHQNDPTSSSYVRRIDNLLSRVRENYDVKHLTGFSKGAHGAITLGDKHNIDTTTFSPYISPANLKTTSNNRHQMYLTTEDVASILAYPFRAKNPNVELNILDPLMEYDTLNPKSTHDVENYIKTDARRSSHDAHLINKANKASKAYAELEYSRAAQQHINQGKSFTEFVRSIDTADVNILDDKLSSRIFRNGLQHKVWKENGGQFKLSEQFHLTSAPEGSYKFATTAQQRKSHLSAHPNEQHAMMKALQEHHEQTLQELTAHEAERQPFREALLKANEGRKALGVSARGAAVGGLTALAGFAADEALDKYGIKIHEDLKAPLYGATAGFLTGGLALAAPMAGGALAGYETSKIVASRVGEMADAANLDPVVKQHAQLVASGASGGAMAGVVTRGIGKVLGGAAFEAVGISTGPFGAVNDAVGGVLITEGISELAQATRGPQVIGDTSIERLQQGNEAFLTGDTSRQRLQEGFEVFLSEQPP